MDGKDLGEAFGIRKQTRKLKNRTVRTPKSTTPQNWQRLLKIANSYVISIGTDLGPRGPNAVPPPHVPANDVLCCLKQYIPSSSDCKPCVVPTFPYHTSLRFTCNLQLPRDTSILSFLSLIRPDPNMSQSHHSKYYLEDEMSVFLVINNHASFYPVSYLFLDRNPSFQSPWAFSKTRLPCLSRDVCLSFPARWYRRTLRRKSHTTSWRDLPGVRGPSRFLL